MIRILIVDDEKPICDLIDLNLSAAGYHCVAVQDGLEAINLIEQEKFDLILLDIMLPGADDYLVKPFEVLELVARVEAVLRRYHKTRQLLTAGDVVVDVKARRVTRAGRPVELTNKEFGLLVLFIKNKNIALFRETLYEKVWEEEYYGDSRTLDLHVQRLRRKLGWEQNLVAVYKVGYCLEVAQ